MKLNDWLYLKDLYFMKAAILLEQNKPLIVRQVDIPKELKYGQVLVKILYTLICVFSSNDWN